MGIEVLFKDSEGSFNKYLFHREFACNCQFEDCARTLYDPRVVNAFLIVRRNFYRPIIVTSAFRCQRHNLISGGLATSYHLIGIAMDLMPEDPRDLDELEKLARVYFDVVVRYDTFIHCHMEDRL